ncbi:proteoglycan Cow, partial [Olea europaea subsp. europaea]
MQNSFSFPQQNGYATDSDDVMSEDKDKIRGYNDVLDTKPHIDTCSPTALQAMGDRLLDWFSVIMADAKKRHTKNKGKTARFPLGCRTEIRWMFQHLDLNSDAQLSLQELYDLEHDQNERCIKPFLDSCDIN